MCLCLSLAYGCITRVLDMRLGELMFLSLFKNVYASVVYLHVLRILQEQHRIQDSKHLLIYLGCFVLQRACDSEVGHKTAVFPSNRSHFLRTHFPSIYLVLIVLEKIQLL